MLCTHDIFLFLWKIAYNNINNKGFMNKKKIIKIIVLIIICLVLAFLLWKLWPLFWNLKTEEGRNNFSNEISTLGYKGPLIIIGMAICKTALIFLPSEPVELISGACFGGFLGWIYVYIGYFISSLIIALLVKKFGIDFVKEFTSQEKIDKIQTKFDENPHKVELTLFFLYFLPVIPKDVLTYVGCLLPISIKRFLAISMFARIPATLSSTIVGANLLHGNWLTIVIVYAITYSISGILAFVYNKFVNKKNVKAEID